MNNIWNRNPACRGRNSSRQASSFWMGGFSKFPACLLPNVLQSGSQVRPTHLQATTGESPLLERAQGPKGLAPVLRYHLINTRPIRTPDSLLKKKKKKKATDALSPRRIQEILSLRHLSPPPATPVRPSIIKDRICWHRENIIIFFFI